MAVTKGGRNICGLSVGVLSLESYFPKPPGHIKNPSSLPFTTCYEVLHGITVTELLNNPSDAMIDRLCEGARNLERQGVRAITGSCGFLALFQRQIAEAVSVPVFLSSLIQFVNGGVKLGHWAAQNWATLGFRGTRVMGGGQSAALSI